LLHDGRRDCSAHCCADRPTLQEKSAHATRCDMARCDTTLPRERAPRYVRCKPSHGATNVAALSQRRYNSHAAATMLCSCNDAARCNSACRQLADAATGVATSAIGCILGL
jgi:hypothetical protein